MRPKHHVARPRPSYTYPYHVWASFLRYSDSGIYCDSYEEALREIQPWLEGSYQSAPYRITIEHQESVLVDGVEQIKWTLMYLHLNYEAGEIPFDRLIEASYMSGRA